MCLMTRLIRNRNGTTKYQTSDVVYRITSYKKQELLTLSWALGFSLGFLVGSSVLLIFSVLCVACFCCCCLVAFVLCLVPMMPMSLDCPFFAALQSLQRILILMPVPSSDLDFHRIMSWSWHQPFCLHYYREIKKILIFILCNFDETFQI